MSNVATARYILKLTVLIRIYSWNMLHMLVFI